MMNTIQRHTIILNIKLNRIVNWVEQEGFSLYIRN